jgi:3-hydroxyisobutyrate dehydrogenase-like beta-hydroxyacid dehydrogenase
MQRFVAAPVFGRPDAAAAGHLVVAAAGTPDAVKAAAPLLDAIGKSTFVASETARILVKLSGNFLFASVIESLGEAMALVTKAGVDRRHYLNFLTSKLFDLPVYKNLWRVDRRWEIRARRVRRASGLQGYSSRPCGR